jgi:GLPGLI family protein
MKNINKVSKVLILLFCLIFNKSIFAQNISAHYSIQRQILQNDDRGAQTIATLSYSGFLFAIGNKSIFFKKPLYLQEFPEGNIESKSGNQSISVLIPMDTIQGLYYIDLDSLVMRYRLDIAGGSNGTDLNFVRNFPRGFQKWEYFPEKKNINGLKCQKAKKFSKDGKLNWEVWFCPDIPFGGGPGGITDLPGLVVEAYCPPWQEKYLLDAYDLNAPISPSVFWPAEFNLGFKQIAPIKISGSPSITQPLNEKIPQK